MQQLGAIQLAPNFSMEAKMMKRVQQQSLGRADCGVACVAMLAGCSYQRAFKAFNFAEGQRQFYTWHHHLIGALEELGCTVKRRKFRSWREIDGQAIVAVDHTKYGDWHWVVFDGEAILDPKPKRAGRKKDYRGKKGKGHYLLVVA